MEEKHVGHADLPLYWQNTLSVRWVLDPNATKHCEACLRCAGEYDSWGHMMAKTAGAQPGYFPHDLQRGFYFKSFGKVEACGDACQCWVEVLLDEEWCQLDLPRP